MIPFLEPGPGIGYEAARVAILPVPYEGTVSYGAGTAHGPAAILAASHQVEFHDEQLGFEPRRAGIWTAPALPVENLTASELVSVVARRFGELVDAGKWVVMLGGEHSITVGGVQALAARRPDLCLVQLDAHADLRDTYEGDRHSHACAMARCLEHASLVRAIGIRSYSPEEAARIEHGIGGYHAVPAWELGQPGWIERALAGLERRPVYLTIDLDYFDPAVMPATGTPEPGGGAWWPTLELLDALFRRAEVVAVDVVELAPEPALRHADFTAARLVHKLIGYRERGLLDARGGGRLP